MDIFNLSRREFLRDAGLVGGGLLLGSRIGWPGAVAAGPEITESLGQWLHIGTDGRITILIELAEMGQGIYTSLPALVAEELEVPWSSVEVAPRPIDGPQRGIITGGSSSIRRSWKPLRRAGAVAREMLVRAAAESWSVPPGECVAREGEVLHRASGRVLGYGELADRAAALPVPASVELKPASEFRLIGRPLPRLDVPSKIDGSAVFGIDVRVEGMLYAAPSMSPVFGGSLSAYDEKAALAVAGVRAVVPLLDGIAVVADHYWQARKGLEALAPEFEGGDTEFESGAYSKRLQEALETPGVLAGEEGDAAGALAGDAKVVDARYEVPFLAHAPMEPMNCTVDARKSGGEVWAPTQSPSDVREVVADVLGTSPEAILVHPTFLGGGFGRRALSDFAVQAAICSKAVQRPVQLIWSREDDIRHDFYRPACAARLQAALDEDGRPKAFVHHLAGTWGDRSAPSWLRRAVGSLQKRLGSGLAPPATPDVIEYRVPRIIRTGIEGLIVGHDSPIYAIPNSRLEYSAVDAEVPVGWWRSVAASHNGFFVESFIDELAHAAGADPFEYRRSLLSGRTRRVLERAAEAADWGAAMGPRRGRGIAIYHSFGSTVCEVAEVHAPEAGTLRVERVVCVVDCGSVVNPDTVVAQMEGSIVFGLTAALYGEITLEGGAVKQGNFHDYPILGLAETPRIDVEIIESEESPGGVGEPGTPPIAAALANAYFAATGKRVRKLPLVSAG